MTSKSVLCEARFSKSVLWRLQVRHEVISLACHVASTQGPPLWQSNEWDTAERVWTVLLFGVLGVLLGVPNTPLEFRGSFDQAVGKIKMYWQSSRTGTWQWNHVRVATNTRGTGVDPQSQGWMSVLSRRALASEPAVSALSLQHVCLLPGPLCQKRRWGQPAAICLSSVPGELCSPLDQGLFEALDAVLSSLPGIQTLQVRLVKYIYF